VSVTPPDAPPGPRVEGPDGDRTLTPLVVEDDPAVAELLRTMLDDVLGWGATVVRAAAVRGDIAAVVAEPFDVDDLVAAVRRVVDGERPRP
jgi:hypothetical protein